eukprot:CAMPEP_0205804514 /NCGR_PEP_ID=MMETSP0205-20121125/7462_1 /ASSEMBLY_ACC=CAM_ASM_000278 /TAXON_ID=36767 /ORGANISM="Euplotes focardii, Strain TN1" /LENGTH=59 /DNA_ID=CAMNT_0053074257 /DNA_START=368 /DNA_END=547 /DNA_ORIENTATION=-
MNNVLSMKIENMDFIVLQIVQFHKHVKKILEQELIVLKELIHANKDTYVQMLIQKDRNV